MTKIINIQTKIANFINKNPMLKEWIKRLKTFTLPGFDKIPVYDVIIFLISEIQKDLIPTRARSISYSFFIAFFPGIIFLFTLLPYIPLQGLQESLISIINEVLPKNIVQNFIVFTIDDVLNKPRAGLLSFASLLTLFFSTQGVVSMIGSFNKSYAIYNKRNYFQMRWLSLKLTLILFVLFITSLVLLIVGNLIIGKLVILFHIQSSITIFLINTLRYLVILLLYFLSISLLYYYGPSAKKKFRFMSVGSSLATFGSIIASLIFTSYVSSLDNYNSIYGFFGSIIMFLSWMYVNAFVLLVGFELNASIYYNKNLKHKLAEKELEELEE
ncbi:MAG: membrane protein [Planctomycetota bacterium]